jgi:hypothetical protein
MTEANLPLFYQQLAALDRRVHTRLKVRPPENFQFAADATLVPLLSAEFGPISREYPIGFIRQPETGEFVPVALTGMPQSKNLFVRADGSWDARYIPAYVLRYPFVFVETSADNFTVCFDPSSKCFDESTGFPLFGEDGEPSDTLKGCIKGLQEYQHMAGLSKAFMKRLADTNILMEADVKAEMPDGRSFQWRGFWIADEKLFRALPEATVKEWFGTGELGLVYAHLLSLSNLSDLLRRHLVVGAQVVGAQATSAPVAAPAKPS